MESASAVLQRRVHGKLDKRRRIGEAARDVFKEYGYKGANMREIARRAGVATGTLFLYAPDKRNLLVWIVNDDLDRLTEANFAAIAECDAPHDLLEQLLFVFEARYQYGSAHPDLSLHYLQELTIKADEAEPNLAEQRRFIMKDHVAELVREHQAQGHIRASEDPETIAQLVLAIYHAAIRKWLRDSDLDVAQGIRHLHDLLRLAIEGCAGPIARGVGGRSN